MFIKIIAIIFLVMLFLVVGGFFYLILTQESQIYRAPNRTNDDYLKRLGEELVFTGDTYLYHHRREDSKAVVVFYHGNENIICDNGSSH